jgi:hypothetical protein
LELLQRAFADHHPCLYLRALVIHSNSQNFVRLINKCFYVIVLYFIRLTNFF